jgi:hypothetical protein
MINSFTDAFASTMKMDYCAFGEILLSSILWAAKNATEMGPAFLPVNLSVGHHVPCLMGNRCDFTCMVAESAAKDPGRSSQVKGKWHHCLIFHPQSSESQENWILDSTK